LGTNAPGAEWSGIAPLHSMPRSSSFLNDEVDGTNPVMYPLFRDLAQVLKQVSRPVAHALHQYMRINIDLLGTLQTELAFYLGAVQLIERVRQRGLPMCRPELALIEGRRCELEDTYNLSLALRFLARDSQTDLSRAVITNDVMFEAEARIFILTGPNQGGKTTYTQAIGQVQVLAQAGLFVPGSRARISPVDTIYTHFPVEEKPNAEAGRLGEESRRLNDIFASATRHSLILLNESLSSTSFGESLYLARDIVRILQLLGARAIYATHLHELAAGVDELNAKSPNGSHVISLVSLVSDGAEALKQTYHIVPGPPRGHSYAREVAARYGISYDQLEQMLRKRGLLNGQ
jgi:DNA mismatch repair ATPase MutS